MSEAASFNQDTVKCSPAQRAMARIEAQRLLARIRKLNRCNVDDMAERVGGTEEDDMFKWVHATYCLVLKEVNGVDFSSFIRWSSMFFLIFLHPRSEFPLSWDLAFPCLNVKQAHYERVRMQSGCPTGT